MNAKNAFINSRLSPLTHDAIEAAVERACGKIAPLWPLKHFVAVNPFVGLSDLSFSAAARTMAQASGGRMTLGRKEYAAAIAAGRISDDDLADALAAAPAGNNPSLDVATLKDVAFRSATPHAPRLLPTLADVAAEVSKIDWGRFTTERISSWAAAYFDDGQASWRSPWSNLSPFGAWRAETAIDRTPEISGLRNFRALVKALPESAAETTVQAIQTLGIPASGLDAYLHRLLMSVAGWSGFARYRVWESNLRGQENNTLAELLAIRLAWELLLYRALEHIDLTDAWAAHRPSLTTGTFTLADQECLDIDLILQAAYENAWQRRLVARLADAPGKVNPGMPVLQAAFCIDVRSEVFRRALESVAPQAQTLGFAGFFGFPIEYVPLGHDQGRAQSPVLLAPRYVISETLIGASESEVTRHVSFSHLRRRSAKAWMSFKLAAVSSLGFVETTGLGYVAKLVTDTLGVTRTVPAPAGGKPNGAGGQRFGPRLEAAHVNGRASGIPDADRLAVAESVLKAMGLTADFAPLVLLIGHGSTTVNNPHATGLDCGACGGHTGEANARLAAAVLNDPGVRSGLAAKGINIPAETFFVGCLHDTTCDSVTVFDDAAPAILAQELKELRGWLEEAGRLARAERALRLNIQSGDDLDGAILRRSRDWSQVRPEWGLAGCAAFIVAPRERTEGVNLGGQSFLHSYAWRQDKGFNILELIMTAPMVVASWISLQYYGSAVDNHAFGAGNKALHNVVGTLGVLEGSGGDLRSGLPWQSLHDGVSLVHEPMRLSVFIEAPAEAISGVIEKHASIRQLLDNGWLHLFRIDDAGTVSERYAGGLRWEAMDQFRMAA
jgi:uncharacterized protein